MDVSKVFGTVPHDILISKLDKCRLDRTTIKWIHNWLNNHKQRVTINGMMSDWREVSNGVPQGSVLGPMLFNIFINDLDVGIESLLVKFSDDSYRGGVANTLEDRAKIQRDLDKLENWAIDDKMKLIKDKCKVLHLWKKNQIHKDRMGDNWLVSSTAEKDLVVVVDPSLNMGQQCDVVAKKKKSKSNFRLL
ncbi:unnamed protein product [Caretta caretta]